LTLAFYAREEGPYTENELGLVLQDDPEAHDVDLAICMEPSDNKLSLGACGSLHAHITFAGRTAHSARPWQGENAIHKAGPFLTELFHREPRTCTIDALVYKSATSVTLAQAGRQRNVVPDTFTLNLNHRFAPDTTIEQEQREIESLLGERARIEWTDLSPAAPPCASHPLVVALREAGVSGVEAKQAWTDVARFATISIPAVNWGPGVNAQAHQRNEWTSIEKLVEGHAILSRFFQTISRAQSSIATIE
jgi:succinyl-diaminopimelate desuccinylase